MDKLQSIAKAIFKNMHLIFGIGILGMDAIAIAAPILAHFGCTEAAHWIYLIFRFLCHQRASRSLHLFDYQLAWCTRDTFIYLSMGLSALFVTKFKIRGIKWYVALLCVIPFALDGILQLVAEVHGIVNNQQIYFYASTNFLRMLTGSIFGAGAGLWIFSLLGETIDEELNISLKLKAKNLKLRNSHYFLIIFLICLVFYLGFIQMWRITSTKYKPSGLLDNRRNFPGVNYEEAGRGGHGV